MAKVFMVIDGSSLIHRAFYALPLLTTSDGRYSNAVYGFANMLVKLLDKYTVDRLIVAFDKSRVTFRTDIYNEYKGQRKATPSELTEQFPLVNELLAAFGIKSLQLDGYEADDIIGTLAKDAAAQGYEVLVVTGDKDALQLIDDKIKVLLTRKGITDMDIYDKAAFVDKYGVEPRQLIDIKGLMGDTSDNIPGVPGVGEKTACKLIAQFGSVENVLADINTVSGKKLQERLRENASLAMLSKRLATIVLDVPTGETIDTLTIKPDEVALREFFQRMEFKSLLAKFTANEAIAEKQATAEKIEFTTVNGAVVTDIATAVRRSGNLYFVPLFSGSLPGLMWQGVAVAIDGQLVYIAAENEYFSQLIGLLADSNVYKWTYEVKPVYQAMYEAGMVPAGKFFDAGLAGYLIDPTATDYGFRALAETYLYTPTPIDNNDKPAIAAAAAAALPDICRELTVTMAHNGLMELYEKIELPLEYVLAKMEWYGITVDAAKLQTMDREMGGQISMLLARIYDAAGEEFNVNSPKQLGRILFEKLQLPVIKKTKTGYSTNAEVLDELRGRHRIIEDVLEYRILGKLKSTYLEGLAGLIRADGRLHTSFNQTVTATGRLSSSEPNLQNIPVRTEAGRRIRELFIPGDDWQYIMSADYSQIELRILAHLSADENLLYSFRHDEDIHARTAAEVFGVSISDVTSELRTKAKAVNFGIVYGISDYGLSRDLGISRSEAAEYIASYFARYAGVKNCIDGLVASARKTGEARTLLGRVRRVPDITNRNFNRRSFAERIAMNTPIQGTAADIIKKAMVDVQQLMSERQFHSRLLLQVHDELIFEVVEEEREELAARVKLVMENALSLKVPLLVDVNFGTTWATAK